MNFQIRMAGHKVVQEQDRWWDQITDDQILIAEDTGDGNKCVYPCPKPSVAIDPNKPYDQPIKIQPCDPLKLPCTGERDLARVFCKNFNEDAPEGASLAGLGCNAVAPLQPDPSDADTMVSSGLQSEVDRVTSILATNQGGSQNVDARYRVQGTVSPRHTLWPVTSSLEDLDTDIETVKISRYAVCGLEANRKLFVKKGGPGCAGYTGLEPGTHDAECECGPAGSGPKGIGSSLQESNCKTGICSDLACVESQGSLSKTIIDRNANLKDLIFCL